MDSAAIVTAITAAFASAALIAGAILTGDVGLKAFSFAKRALGR